MLVRHRWLVAAAIVSVIACGKSSNETSGSGGSGASGKGGAESTGSGGGTGAMGGASAKGGASATGGATGSASATGSGGSGGSGGIPLPSKPHGLFMLDPATKGALYTGHVLPVFLCKAQGDPVASCTGKGAGYDAVKGATFQFAWKDVMPTNGTPDFTAVKADIAEWTAAGKTANVVFQTVGYTAGPNEVDPPPWYPTTVAATVTQDAGGNLTVTTTMPMSFFVGSIGGQWIQITGTTHYDGIYPIQSSSDAMHLVATGNQANGAHTDHGTVGNPMLGTPCNDVPAPVFWSPNFVNAWQAVMQAVHDQLDGIAGLGYVRFGLGIGGENAPVHDIGKTSMNPAMDCPTQMVAAGYTTQATPWPGDQTQAWEDDVVKPVWIDQYQTSMLAFLHTLGFTKLVSVSLSPTVYGTQFDWKTPDATAALAAGHGFAIGDQGWQESDKMTAMSGGHCTGDYCALFPMYLGQVPLELQSVLVSNPGDAAPDTTGDMTKMFPWAISQGAQILEIYPDDFGCTFDSGYTPTGNTPPANTYAACQAAGYPAAFTAAAAALD